MDAKNSTMPWSGGGRKPLGEAESRGIGVAVLDELVNVGRREVGADPRWLRQRWRPPRWSLLIELATVATEPDDIHG